MTYNLSGFLHPEHSQAAKNEAARDAFTDVVSVQKDGKIMVDLSALPADADVIITGTDTVASVEFQQEENAMPTPKAFEQGHVFTQEDLPADKQHLIGALYFADNEDGSMLIVSHELRKMPTGWGYLGHIISEINRDWAKGDNPEVRIGTSKDWNTLLKSEFMEQAKLFKKRLGGPTPLYWQQGPMDKLRDSFRTARDPSDYERRISLGIKKGRAYGRFFADVPRFEPIA